MPKDGGEGLKVSANSGAWRRRQRTVESVEERRSVAGTLESNKEAEDVGEE